MKTTLPTLIHQVLKYNLITNESIIRRFKEIQIFAYFLIQKLKLWMFIPCNKDGEPMEEPKKKNYIHGTGKGSMYEKAVKEYQQAKDRVIFKGFKIIDYNGTKSVALNLGNLDYDRKPIYLHVFWLDVITKKWNISKGLRIISDLCLDVDLTEAKHKELNL